MTSSIGKSYWPLVAAVGLGVGFVSYCFYFDQKRRNAPDFREKLRAKRLKTKNLSNAGESSGKFTGDVNDPEEMRQFFLEQIQKGEDCLSRGDLENGVEHLAKAVAVCSQPQNLLSLFQQTLPPELFQEIIRRLPHVAQSMMSSAGPSLSSGAIITEPDLE